MSGKHIKKEDNKKISKKSLITILSIVIALVLILLIVLGVNVYNASKVPDEARILSDLNGDKMLTQVEIGNATCDFKVETLEVIASEKSDDETKCEINCSFERTSDTYKYSKAEYVVVYDIKLGAYNYNSSTLNKGEQLELSPIKGVSVEDAQEKVTKKYKDGVTFKEQKTDLEKGTDKVYFNINNDEYKGTVFANYKFDQENGWKFKGINDSKLNFKAGVTHKENGLYTNSNVKNIMLFGVDADSLAGRSDCMMLVSIDSNTNKIKLTSFLRDTYVSVPNYGGTKLNSSFAYGGAELTVDAIEANYGIKIDNYVATNFTTFKNIINAIGGVTVNISADEAGYINWQLNKNGQSDVGLVPSGGGNVTLNGQQALWLCRDRGGNGFSGNDFVRTDRQRRVIQSLISKYKNLSSSQVLSTINALKGYVATDLTAKNFQWYAERAPKYFQYEIVEKRAPDDGQWSQGYSPAGAWIISVNNWDSLKSDIQKFIYEDLKQD